MADARTEGTFAQNAELVGAAYVDSTIDAPFWLWNKITGSSVPAPAHLAADVYASQTDGMFSDADGNVLTSDQVSTAAGGAEDKGAVIDAANQTAKQIADNPLSIIPTWALVVGVVALALVALYYGTMIIKVVKS